MTTIQPLGAGNLAIGNATTSTSTGSRDASASESAPDETVQLDAAGGAAYDRHGSGALPRLAGGTISILA